MTIQLGANPIWVDEFGLSAITEDMVFVTTIVFTNTHATNAATDVVVASAKGVTIIAVPVLAAKTTLPVTINIPVHGLLISGGTATTTRVTVYHR